METNLTSRKRRLKTQIPDIGSSLILINKLRAKKEANEDTETEFLLSDSVYASARIPATEKVNYFMKILLQFLKSMVDGIFYHELDHWLNSRNMKHQN